MHFPTPRSAITSKDQHDFQKSHRDLKQASKGSSKNEPHPVLVLPSSLPPYSEPSFHCQCGHSISGNLAINALPAVSFFLSFINQSLPEGHRFGQAAYLDENFKPPKKSVNDVIEVGMAANTLSGAFG